MVCSKYATPSGASAARASCATAHSSSTAASPGVTTRFGIGTSVIPTSCVTPGARGRSRGIPRLLYRLPSRTAAVGRPRYDSAMEINLVVLSVGNSRLALAPFRAGELGEVVRLDLKEPASWGPAISGAWKQIAGRENAAVVGA